MNKKSRTIVYVNFTPYENAGHILDYIRENFETVIEFSFNFHRVSQHQHPSSIYIYTKGTLTKIIKLFQIPISVRFAFILLPLRSFIIFLNILVYLVYLRTYIPRYDIFFTVNGFIAWAGIVLKRMGLVQKTIFWVWDFYPQTHENIGIHIMRTIYWQFDKIAIRSDNVVFMTERLLFLHSQASNLNSSRYNVIGIGTLPHPPAPKVKKRIILAFMGVVKRSEGLDMIIDIGNELTTVYKTIELRVFGGGPDEEYFRKRAKHTHLNIRFYGYISSTKKLHSALQHCSIGVAVYKPEPSNVSYYGDPSKIKAYLSQSLPVITTDTFEFHKEILKQKAGIVVRYGDTEEFINAIHTILKSYKYYSTNALRLSKKYTYKNLYEQLLND